MLRPDSLTIFFTDFSSCSNVSVLLFANINVLPFSEGIPAEVISYLDPTIKKLNFEEKNEKPIIYLNLKEKKRLH